MWALLVGLALAAPQDTGAADTGSADTGTPTGLDEDADGDVPEGVPVRAPARLAEVTTLALLEPEMHARKECAADE